MKTKLPCFIFVILVVSALSVSVEAAGTNKAGVFSFLPVFEDVTSGVDARDENNSSVVSGNAELEALFSSCLYSLLVTAEVYSFAKAIEILKSKLNPSNSVFARELQEFVSFVMAVAVAAKKFFANVLVVLSSLNGFGFLLVVFFSLFPISYPLFPVVKAPAVLRC